MEQLRRVDERLLGQMVMVVVAPLVVGKDQGFWWTTSVCFISLFSSYLNEQRTTETRTPQTLHSLSLSTVSTIATG